jgi:uncharacterized cupin superfamily protein
MLGTYAMSNANNVNTGVWECTPGEFTVASRPNTESIVILSGRVRLTDLDSNVVTELTAGDAAVLELGSSVKWEVLETTRKFYVIC